MPAYPTSSDGLALRDGVQARRNRVDRNVYSPKVRQVLDVKPERIRALTKPPLNAAACAILVLRD
jgi:hypothetical protein